MRSAQHHYCWLFFLLGYLATEGFAGGAAHPAQVSSISPNNFEVLGIRLPDSTVSDVERILGPAPSAQTRDAEGAVMCYTSLGTDRTVLEFESWFESIVAFRLFTGTLQSASHCAKSKLISVDLATASGLRLGMTTDEVIAAVGSIAGRHANRLTYDFSYERPPTPEETKRFKDAYRPLPASIYVYGKIDLRFRQGKLVRVDAARGYDF